MHGPRSPSAPVGIRYLLINSFKIECCSRGKCREQLHLRPVPEAPPPFTYRRFTYPSFTISAAILTPGRQRLPFRALKIQEFLTRRQVPHTRPAGQVPYLPYQTFWEYKQPAVQMQPPSNSIASQFVNRRESVFPRPDEIFYRQQPRRSHGVIGTIDIRPKKAVFLSMRPFSFQLGHLANQLDDLANGSRRRPALVVKGSRLE